MKPYGLELEKGEKIVWIGKRSLRSLWLPFLIGFIALPLYGLGVIFIIYAIAKWLKTDYVVTNKRIAKVTRHYAFVYLVSYDVDEIRHEEIKSVYSLQHSMGTRFRYWNLIIENGKKIIFEGIRDVEEVKGAIEKFRNK